MNAPRTILSIVLLGALAGCSKAPSSEAVCVANMQQLWEAARSHHLERKLSDDQLVSPSELTNYLRGGAIPQCPLGTNPYAPFSYRAGPVCPNSDTHTHALRANQR
jgi:hypothetical protein